MMDYGNLMDNHFTDIYLNEEPPAHEKVEERIRQLQVVTARAVQRQSHRCELKYVHNFGDFLVNKDVEGGIIDEICEIGSVDTNAENGRGRKRDSSHLVKKALALAMDSPAKKRGDEGAGIWYDCNICLDLAKDPILTCCGHLFCWACFYQLGYIDSISRECPVCKGEVSDVHVIPIYGNGGSKGEGECESGLKVPPRPKARRVESFWMPN